MKDTSIIIVALIIAMVIIAPSIVSGFGSLFDQIGDWITYGFGDNDQMNGNENGTITGGNSGLGITIYYQDGTHKDFEPALFSIIALEIGDSGGAITKLVVTIYVTPTQTGTSPISWTIDGTLQIQYYDPSTSGGPLLISTETKTILESGGTWQNGEQKQIVSYEFSASHIENIVKSHGEQGYSMSFSCDLELEYKYPDGSYNAKSATASTQWVFYYEKDPTGYGELQSISVTVQSSPFH